MEAKERNFLFKKSRAGIFLSITQLLTVLWWGWFNKRKYDKFFNELKRGKFARYAFEDSKIENRQNH